MAKVKREEKFNDMHLLLSVYDEGYNVELADDDCIYVDLDLKSELNALMVFEAIQNALEEETR